MRKEIAMLNFSIMKLMDEHIDEICSDIEYQVKNGIATMPLFSMTLVPEGDPAIDKAELLSKSYEKFKARLDALGIPSGALIQASIGHGGKLNADSAFQKYIGFNDGTQRAVCCPLDEGFRQYIRKSAERIAKAAPAHIMLDDDFRLMARPQRGCACPLHMAKFNELCGTDLTREELYEAICKDDALGRKYREAFIKVEIDSLVGCAKEIRAGIDSVDPTIPGSFCLCGKSAEGAFEIASIMAGAKNPVTVRVNNSNYCAPSPRFFAHVMHRAASQIAALRGKPDYILAETDTCPHNRYSTSAAMLHAHFTFSILEGAAGAKHWLTRTVSYEPASGKAYRKKLQKNLGFYEELSRITPRLTWLGCKIPIPKEPVYVLTPEDNLKVGDGWYAHVLDRFGLPMHFSPSGEGAVFLDSAQDKCFTDEELLEFLSGKVVLDGAAAEDFIERGFGKYLGVDVRRRDPSEPNASGELIYPSGSCLAQPNVRELTPLSESTEKYTDVYHLRDGVYRDVMFPGVTSYKNELGGTVVVFAGSSSFEYGWRTAFGMLNETRKKNLIKILTDLGTLPIYYPEDGEILMKAAKTEDDGLLCAILNMGLDVLDELPLIIKRDVKSIRRLCPDGSYEPLKFEKEDELYTVKSPLGVFDPLILIID